MLRIRNIYPTVRIFNLSPIERFLRILEFSKPYKQCTWRYRWYEKYLKVSINLYAAGISNWRATILFIFIYLKQQYRNCFLHSMNQTYRNCFSRWVLPQQQNSSYLCRVIFKEPVQPLILFWASRWVIPCALIPSMLRTTSPILTCACDALPPSFSCNK